MSKGGYGEILQRLERNGQLRQLRPLADRRGCRARLQGREMFNLTSNDYLGLAGNREIQKRFYQGMAGAENPLELFGLGAASSRLLTGDTPVLHALEEELLAAYGFSAALFFNSGYHANIGILPALFGKNDLILSDKLNHASIHDGLRLSSAVHRRYRHCDYAHLESLLAEHRNRHERAVIVSESVFSMDGDVADLGELVRLKKQYHCMLYLDEAHAVGLYGPKGLGMAEEQGVLTEVDLLVGTFGKALASVGAYLLAGEDIRAYLINHSRSLIFTTALPPVNVSWNLFVFQTVLAMHEERRHLRELGSRLRAELVARGIETAGTTNIVPVFIGDNERTVRAARAMQEQGYLIFPVRPPTVPKGTARFRLSLTADMQWSDLASLPSTIAATLARHLPAGGSR